MAKSIAVPRGLSHLMPAVMAAILTFLVTVALTFAPFVNAGGAHKPKPGPGVIGERTTVVGIVGVYQSTDGISVADGVGDYTKGVTWIDSKSNTVTDLDAAGNACQDGCPHNNGKARLSAHQEIKSGARHQAVSHKGPAVSSVGTLQVLQTVGEIDLLKVEQPIIQQ